MIVRVLLAAILAGVLAGLLLTIVQELRVTPLILEAEQYENGIASSKHSDTSHAGAEHVDANSEKSDGHDHAPAAESAHSHDATDWAPEDGFERTFYTAISNILVGVAFALLMCAAIMMSNTILNVQSGLVWGAAGFISFVLAPNFGLSPELPGMPAGDLESRQIWWVGTAIATVIALFVFAFKQQIFWLLGGLVILLLPHLIGAPQPDFHDSQVPAYLAAEFTVATTVSMLLFWLFLGGTMGWMLPRLVVDEGLDGRNEQ